MSDIQRFTDELEAELLAAAERRNQTKPAPSRARPLALAAVTTIGILLTGITMLQLGKASADTFVIRHDGPIVHIDVVDILDNPDAVSRQFTQELGATPDIIAVPADPQLVGRIGVVGTTGTVAPTSEVDEFGTITRINLPDKFNGKLILKYGRAAIADEPFNMITSSPLCKDHYGQTTGRSITEVSELATNVRFETTTSAGIGNTDVDPDTIPRDYRLADLQALSDQTLLATYAEDITQRPTHPNCQP